MKYLEDVAMTDVAEVTEKERTYQGSWKKSGGRSAWFMLRRKMDRMINMLQRPEPPETFNLTNVDDTIAAIAKPGATWPGSPEATAELLRHLRDSYAAEDIFAKIAADPTGADGSVLAEVRDLRRYLLLVEAEMIARGVVSAGRRARRAEAEYDYSSISRRIEKALAREDRRVPRYEPGTPEDGGHHARQED